jgi:hypothetical protein
MSAKGNISDLIFRHTLKTIDLTEGYSRLLEECNKYDVIIKKLGKQLNKRIPDPKQKGKHLSIVDIKADVYVRAPVVDHCTARLEAFGTRLKNKHNIRPPVENDLPTTVSIVKIESISVTSPLDTTMEDDLLDNNSQPDNVLQEESIEVVLQLQPAYDQRDVRAILALATMRRNANAIIPSVEKLRETLVASFSSVHRPGWCLDQISRDALWLLQTRYETFEPIFIAPRIYLYPCDYREGGSKRNCLAYSIRAIAMNLSLPCDNYRDGKYGSQRRLSRHSSDDWTNRIQDTTAPLRLTYLSAAEMNERYLSLKKKATATKQKKLTSRLDEITLDDSDKVMKDILRKAMAYVKENESTCQKTVLKALMAIEQKRAGVSIDVNNNESTNEEMAEMICNQMRNNAHVIAGTERQIRYSARSIRIAMALWLRSPAAYREFKDSSLTIIPDQNATIERQFANER